jgi:predicted transcriptional regulator
MADFDSRQLTPAQLRAARALIDITAKELAELSRVSLATIRRAEGVTGPTNLTAANAETLVRSLERRGVEFISENGGGPGVRLRR